MTHIAYFTEYESAVRSLRRGLPSLLRTAKGATIMDANGRILVDFFSACGALKHGHNHPHLKEAALQYLWADGISASMDFHTEAKLRFMTECEDRTLKPRGLAYKMQFPDPTEQTESTPASSR